MDTSKNGNLWQAANREPFAAGSLDRDTSADLVIVGGGFTGCSAALHAAKAGFDVVLLEAETIGFGGSGRNVGLVNAGLWMPPAEVESALGIEAGEKLNTALAGAPDLVFSLIEEHAIECEAVRNGTLHCANSRAGLRDLSERHAQLTGRGAPVTLLNSDETATRTGSKRFQGALYDVRAGTIQPLAYCQGLAQAARHAGARLHAGSRVTGIGRRGTDWIAETPSASVTGKALLMATNAYQMTTGSVPSSSFIPVHYFQMATRPLEPDLAESILPGLEGCWDTAMVMSSFRRNREGRLIIGGIGSLDHGTSAIHRHWAKRKLARLYPALSEQTIEYAWCGRIAMTSDHIPKIVRLGPSALSVYGFSGRGIGPGTLFGARTAAALTEGNEDDLPVGVIDSHREHFSKIRALGYELGAALYHGAGM